MTWAESTNFQTREFELQFILCQPFNFRLYNLNMFQIFNLNFNIHDMVENWKILPTPPSLTALLKNLDCINVWSEFVGKQLNIGKPIQPTISQSY